MEILDLIQGTPEWHAHRANHLNASDAPAMMGLSKYKTRSQLIHEMKTGIVPEVDAATQKRFDDGHKYEALARPLAEKIIGDELYPITGKEGIYSASFDGLTMNEDIAFEHKSLNDELRAIFAQIESMPADIEAAYGSLLSKDYRIQMEQQCMVADLDRVLFMASKWNGDSLVEEHHCWYVPDLQLRQEIIDGWAQLLKDVDDYVPVEKKPDPVVITTKEFPVPSVQVRGEVTMSNLAEITPFFDKFLVETKTELETDADFAQADADAKTSRNAAKELKLQAKSVIDQIQPVSAAVRMMEDYAAKFDALGLSLEKAVKVQKEALKASAIMKAKESFSKHVAVLEAEIMPLRLNLISPDFATAIKGVQKLDSMHDRINTALASGKTAADAAARDIRTKLAWYRDAAAGHEFLFADLSMIISKAPDDFQLLVTTRIDQHKQAEAKREADLAERIRQEQAAKVVAPASPAEAEPTAQAAVHVDKSQSEPVATKLASNVRYFSGARPTKAEITDAVAKAFAATPELAEKWIRAEFGLAKAA